MTLRFWTRRVCTLVALVCLAAPAAARSEEGRSDSLYKHLAVFAEALGLTERAYVDELDEAMFLEGALEGLLDALDPFSLLVPAGEISLFEHVRRVGASRSGLMVAKERGIVYVLAVVAGSPAEEAGLRPGDLVPSIDGEQTRDMPVLRIRSTLAGEPGSTVRLDVLRGGIREEMELVLGEFPLAAPSMSRHDGVPVLRMGALGPKTVELVESILTGLAPEAAAPADRLADRIVLDLRGLAGGDAESAYRLAGLFAAGELGALLSRGEVLETFRSDREPRFVGRTVLLVDRSTQGPAEIVATVLRQKIDAALVGAPSYGHCGRQSLLELVSGDRLLITDAFYGGPDLEPIDRALEPDLSVLPAPFAADGDEDPVLEAAIRLLLEEDGELEEVALASPAVSSAGSLQ